MYYPFFYKFLSKIDPEYAHELVFQKLNNISGMLLKFLIRQKVPKKPIVCMGLTFKNPLGLAAGLDKNGEYINLLDAMGFGYIEIGTVTPLPQRGNSKPRLFCLLEAEGFINRMGFNNLGVDYLIENIKNTRFSCILGINIGKNQNTKIEQGKDDYIACMEKIYTYADYIAINISSPNTIKLRTLQYGEMLDDLLMEIKKKQKELYNIYHKYVPLLVKIAPDLSREELVKMADSSVRYNIDGIIATNTTLDRTLVQGMKYSNEIGGLSGRPLQLKSTEIINLLSKELNGRLPIIGVGGIDSVTAAREKINAGATLIQIYSALIFHGPSLVKKIVTHI